jgi:hypothetical protein
MSDPSIICFAEIGISTLGLFFNISAISSVDFLGKNHVYQV